MCELCDDKEKIKLPECLDTVGSVSKITLCENKLDTYTQTIKYYLASVNKNFLRLGEELKVVRERKMWQEKNSSGTIYKSFEQYCLVNFDLEKSQAYRFVKIYDFYDSFGDVATRDKFSFSQFQELISIAPDDKELLNKITPSMSIKTIRELKHYYYKAKQKQAVLNLQTVSPKKEPVVPERPKFEDLYAETLKVIEEGEIKPLVLKNIDERKKFLTTYREWELIVVSSYLGLKIYRRRLKNHTAILAIVCENIKNLSASPSVNYSVFLEPENKIDFGYHYSTNYLRLFNSETEVVDFLTKNKTNIE